MAYVLSEPSDLSRIWRIIKIFNKIIKIPMSGFTNIYQGKIFKKTNLKNLLVSKFRLIE